VLSHKHPDDYPHIAATLDDIRRTHKPFSTRDRIITVQGDVRDVVVIGERLDDNTGEIVGFPRNRGGFLYAASGWMAAIFSYSTGGSNPAELWRRRVL
jgi:hypothetical protein